MAGMQLTVIGCSGSFPGPDSPASCYLLEAEGFQLVMDMGNGALGVLQQYTGLFEVTPCACRTCMPITALTWAGTG